MAGRSQSNSGKTLVWVIGTSLLMDGIASSLQGRKRKISLRKESIDPKLSARIQAKKPTLIIFEMVAPDSYLLLDLLRENPGIQLLGIDQTCSQVIILNSYQKQTHSMTELYQIVQEIATEGSLPERSGIIDDKL